MSASAGEGATLAACEYCHQIVGAPRSFASMWHRGTEADAPSCCLTEHYLRQQAGQQAPQQPQEPQSSGPINVRPRAGAARSGQTSPLIIVDESRR